MWFHVQWNKINAATILQDIIGLLQHAEKYANNELHIMLRQIY